MKRFYKFLMPLAMIVALALPWKASAQGVTLTVADGTATNSYIPVYGFYVDAAQHNQVIYPASMVGQMAGSSITALTFYMSSPASSAWGTTVTLKMKEVTETTLSGLASATDAMTVWTGTMNGNTSTVEIQLTVPYVYSGGNLLLDITTTAATWSSCTWTGVSASSAAWYSYNSTSNTQDFIPKTTFTYAPSGDFCFPVTGLTATTTTNTIDINWNAGGDESEWLVTLGNDIEDVVSDTFYTFGNLDLNTVYNIAVRAICDNGDTSFPMQITARTLAGDPVSDFPFVCTFEDPDTNLLWVIENGSPNGWYIGGAVNHGGDSSLYISNDNGTSNAYTVGTACVSYAYVTMHFEPGDYAYSFDWQANGESTYDFLRVAYAPYGTTLPTTYTNWASGNTAAPAGFTNLDGGKLNGVTSWQTKEKVFSVATEGDYNFYLVWRNDGSSGTQPPAAIDNFVVRQLTCTAPSALTVDTMTSSSVTLSWTANSDESEWVVIVNDTTVIEGVDENPYTVDNLEPYTVYSFKVKAVCDVDDTSFASSSISTRTLATCPAPTGLTVTDVDATSITIGWNTVGEETEWLLSINDSVVVIDENPYTIEDLAPNTNYTLVLAALCSADDTSLTVQTTTQTDCLGGSCFITIYAEDSYGDGWNGNAINVMQNGTLMASYSMPSQGLSSTTIYDTMNVQVCSGDLVTLTYTSGSYADEMGGTVTDGGGNVVFTIENMDLLTSGATLATVASPCPSCLAPTTLTVDSVTTGSITLHWNAGNDEVSGWSVYVENTFVETVTDPYYTVENLDQYTYYSIQVRTLCSDDDSSTLSQPVNVRTLLSCPLPTQFAATMAGDTVNFTWANNDNAASWQLVYGQMGFNPRNASSDAIIDVYENSYELTEVDTGFFDAYVRTVCSDDDLSAWVGPVSYNYGVTFMNMATTGTNTISSCAAIIYDNGGPSGNYSDNCNSTLYILPGDPNSDVVISGSMNTESGWDYLYIYEGHGTTGTQLLNASGSRSFGPFTGSGFTVVFTSDVSNNYSGFQINVGCVAGPDCPRPTNFHATEINPQSIEFAWNDEEASDWIIAYGPAGFTLGTSQTMYADFDETNGTIGNLNPETAYDFYLMAVCGTEEGDTSWTVMTTVTTIPSCGVLTDIQAITTVSHAALSWTASVSDPNCQALVEYRLATDTAWTPAGVATGTTYAIDGLTAATDYVARLAALCANGDTSLWVSVDFTTADFGCLVIDTTSSFSDTLINGTVTSSYIPYYSTYNYSLTQQIFTAAEIGHGGQISSLFLMPSAYAVSRNVEIYMGHVTEATATAFLNPSDLTLVYTGTVATLNASQWNEFVLSTPFVYNGTDNLLIYFRDMTGSWQSGNTWYGDNGTSGVSRYDYNDDAPYTIGATAGGNTGTFRCNIILAGAACAVQATCAAPAVMVTNIDSTSIGVEWIPGDNETAWNLNYRVQGDSVWTPAATSVTATTYTYTNLDPATDYEFQVVNSCTEGDFATVVNATTLCAPVHLPYTEDFQNASGVYNRHCWVVGSTNLGTSVPEPTVVTLQGDAENKLCLIYNGGYLVMPQASAPLNELQIRFTLLQGADSVRFLMGLLPEQDMNIENIMVLDTLIRSNIDTSVQSVNYTYSFANLPVEYNNYYIAFWDAFNDNYTFLDNMVLEFIPSCAPVTGATASAVTTNSATISWEAAAAANGYIVEYGPRNFVPGTGDTVFTTANTLTLTGLNHSTNYDAYVYTACTALGDTSIASQVVLFTTECDVISALPYAVDFENIMSAGSSATNVLPNCWTAEPIAVGGTMPHTVWSSSATYYQSPTHSLYFGDLGVAALPEMSMPLDSLMVSFFVYNPAPSTNGLIIGAVDSLMPGFAASFTPIDTVIFNSNAINYTVFLSEYTGDASHIAFKNYNTSATATSAAIYVDDITVNYIPSCIAPQRVRATQLTNVSADLEWVISNAPNYNIEYGVHGFTPGTGTPLTSNTQSVSITGLTALTEYDVRIVGVCDATDISDTTVFTFTTLRAAPVIQLPYFCDFADSAEANAWEPVNGTAANGWYVGSAVHFGTGDPNALYISNNNGVSNAYSHSATPAVYAYRTFSVPDGSYTVSFNWLANGEGNFDYLRAYLVPANIELQAGIAPNGGTTSNGNATAAPQAGWIALGAKLNLMSTWETFEQEIDLTAGSYSLVFYWGNDGSLGTQPPAAIDNISFTRNVCPIANLQVDTVTGNSATISWQGNSDSYDVEYGIAGFAHGTGDMSSVNGTTITLNGLASLSRYDVYVRGICNGNADTSRWYYVSLSTDMCDNPVIAQNWDSTMASGESQYSPLGTSFYNYGYIQTLIEPAFLNDLNGDITALSFKPNVTTAGNYYSNMDIYLANVPDTTLGNGWILPDSNHVFVQVVSGGNLNYTTTNEQVVAFDAPFTWDGQSHLLVVVNRRHGSYLTGARFAAHTHTRSMTRYAYQDGSAYNYANPDVTGTAAALTGDLRFYSCGAGCPMPRVTGIDTTYHSITVNWTNSDSTEVAIVPGMWDETLATPTPVTPGTHTYTFDNLSAETLYSIGLRTLCEDNMTSAWTVVNITTPDLPCLMPTNVAAVPTVDGAVVTWTAGGNETAWTVRVIGHGDTIFQSVNTTPTVTLTGLYNNTDYTVEVKSDCDLALGIESDYTAPVTFHTLTCDVPTNVHTTAVYSTSATIEWTGTAEAYEVRYGFEITTSTGTVITTNTNSATLTGLDEDTEYDVYVRAICSAGNYSSWTAVYHFTTTNGSGPQPTYYTITVSANNPAWGTVTGGGTYEAGQTATLTATANAGYHFVQWNDGNADSVRTITVTGNASYVATFEANGPVYYMITATSNNDNWGTVTGGGRYEAGQTATLIATSNAGYHFVMWNDNNTDSVRTITVTGNATYMAIFAENGSQVEYYTVTVTANDSTMGTVNGGGTYPENTVITISATANAGYHFVMWNDNNTDSVRTITVTGNVTYTATFAQNEGIAEVNGANVTLYPNPASTMVTIDGIEGEGTVTVVDMNGRTVAEFRTYNTTLTIDLNGYAKGAYFVRITGERTNAIRKLIVK